MGEYLDDAALFLRETSRLVDRNMTKVPMVQAAMNLGLGMERLLKEILWRINPAYILINPDFKNSMPLLYPSLVLGKSREIAEEPDGDVLSFRNSLSRACVCSKVALENKSLLYAISHFRDIIAHNRLSLLEFDKIKVLLQRDFYPLVKDFSKDLECSSSRLFDGHEVKLAELAASLEVDLEKVLERKLSSHQVRWKSLKGSQGFVEDKERVTSEILGTPNKVPVACPACANIAVLYGTSIYEFNHFEQREVCVGVRVTKLKCQFCKLEITDYKLIDHMGLAKKFDELGVVGAAQPIVRGNNVNS
jgi:hypothetical protein